MARTRRSAQEARAHLVAVAREQIARSGPAALRLKEVAVQAGVSHPTILHHFGSREGLVAAVVADTMGSLQEELKAELARQTALDPAPFVQRLAQALTEGGFVRLLAWLALSDEHAALPEVDASSLMASIYQARLQGSRPGQAPSLEKSTFAAMLTVSALVGEAIMGDLLRRSLGAEGEVSRESYHERLGQVLALMMEHS